MARLGRATPNRPIISRAPAILFYRDGTSGQASGAVALTIPATVQVGDLLVMTGVYKTAAATATILNPAGWTVLSAGVDLTGGSANGSLWTRVAQAGDAGSTVTLTPSSATQQLDAVLVAYPGAAAAPRNWGFTDQGVTASTSVNVSSQTAQAGDIIVLIGVARTGSNGTVTFTAPAGYTMRQQVTSPSGAAQNVAAFAADGQVSGTQTVTASRASWAITGQIVLQPAVAVTAVSDGDTASAADAQSLALTGADTAAVVDAASGAATTSSADTASAADAAIIGLTGADSVATTEAAVVGLAAADTAGAAEAAVVAVGAADTAGVADGQTVGPTAADTAAVADTGVLAAAVSGADSAAVADAEILGSPISAADTATIAESAAVVVAVPAADSAAVLEAATVSVSAASADVAGVADLAVLAAAVAAADLASVADSASLALASADVAVVVDDASAALASRYVARPNIGTVTRPNTGYVIRPNTGLVVRP